MRENMGFLSHIPKMRKKGKHIYDGSLFLRWLPIQNDGHIS